MSFVFAFKKRLDGLLISVYKLKSIYLLSYGPVARLLSLSYNISSKRAFIFALYN